MREAAALILQFVEGKSLEDYLGDPLLRSGVERQFEIIGEAMSQLLARRPNARAWFADPARVVAFRNVLIHGYATVSDVVVWGVIEASLLTLVSELETLELDEP